MTECNLEQEVLGKVPLLFSLCKSTSLKITTPLEDSYRMCVTVDEVPCVLQVVDTASQAQYSVLQEQYIRR